MTELWVFGYGSLIWRPDFPFLERRIARLNGAHRALCVYSFVHRGTPEKPVGTVCIAAVEECVQPIAVGCQSAGLRQPFSR